MDTVVQELKREEARRDEAARGAIDPVLAARLAKDRMNVGARFGHLGDASWDFKLSDGGGLVEAGVAALVALLKRAG